MAPVMSTTAEVRAASTTEVHIQVLSDVPRGRHKVSTNVNSLPSSRKTRLSAQKLWINLSRLYSISPVRHYAYTISSRASFAVRLLPTGSNRPKKRLQLVISNWPIE